MKELKWYFPKTIDEAADLLKQDKTFLHAGGTGLLQKGLSGINGLIDLSRLPLRYFRTENGSFEIGSMSTYADVVSALTAVDPENILVKSLRYSANTPLRNRITIGGSVAFFPPWSDLLGGLLALDAEVVLAGNNEGSVPIEDYVSKRSLRQGSLITAVKFQLSNWRTFYYRENRTKNDDPAFNITVMLKTNMNKIEDSRIFVVGTTGKYSRLSHIEDYLNNRNIEKVEIEEIEKMVSLKFVSRKIKDPEYSSHVAGVELGRGIEQLLRGH